VLELVVARKPDNLFILKAQDVTQLYQVAPWAFQLSFIPHHGPEKIASSRS